MQCPRCQHENPPQAKFCLECGARVALTCTKCRSELPAGAKFCLECGEPVAPKATAEPRFTSPESYTPKHLAEKILTSKAALEGERKQVTVLFADLKGSMELLADRDPEEARKILDPVLERMMEAVHRYEGTVNQVMGDGIMALFGAPIAHEDHAVRACYAALRMQELVRRYSDDLRRAQGVEVQIRVGLNSGEVVVRSIGSDLHMDYTAVGQTTHLAARMEQLASPGATRLTADTLALAEGFVQARSLGLVPIKGVAEPVEIFELVGAGTARTRLQAAHARGFTRFVGRDVEVEQIRQSAEQARQGRGQVVAVVGDAGVGKSRLFYEFLHSHHVQGWLVLEASSVSYGKATAFLPLADLLRAYFRIDNRDDTRSVRAKVTGTLLTLDRTLEDAVPEILWLLDALPPDDAFVGQEPAERRRRAVDSVKRVLLRESRVQPLLLVFEDMHWVDAETQIVLDSIVESLPTAPVLLAINFRPEYRHRWGNKTYYRQLRVDPLPAARADELLDALLGDDASMAALKTLLIARTDGNPLFLEESVRTLLETGTLVGKPGAYRLHGGVDLVQVPATVQAILAARIDRLRPEWKRLLQAASVIGKDVPMTLLEAIAQMPSDELRGALTELQAAEFLYEARLFPELEYTFKHALTHEVAYGSVLVARRRALHAAIVGAIERTHADRLAESVELLAHHAVRGAGGANAARYLRQAGEKAFARSASRQAIGFFEEALRILDELGDTRDNLSAALDVCIALGPAQITVDGAAAPAVAATYRRAFELVERLQDTARRFPVLWGLWFISYTRGRYAEARDAGLRLLEEAQNGDDSGRLLEAHHAMWPTLLAMGETTAVVPHVEQGIAIYRMVEHASQAFVYAGHDAGACCRYQGAIVQWLLGYPERAEALMRDAERLSDELRLPFTASVVRWMAALLQYQRGERAAAVRTAQRVSEIAEAHDIRHWLDLTVVLAHGTHGTGLSAAELGEMHRRLMLVGSAVWRRVFCLCVLAELSLEAGHPAEARRALASIGETGRQGFLAAEVQRLDGELHVHSAPPDVSAAERCFTAAIELARQRQEKSLELRATISLVRLRRAHGGGDDAQRALADLYGWFTEGFDTADLRNARTLLDELSAVSK
jgi:class 3 adenylate cyclase/tetratricopeptide (TPR) repeat protein